MSPVSRSVPFALVASLAALPAIAEPSYQITTEVGAWSNQDGGSGIESNGGIDGEDNRGAVGLNLSYANTLNNGMTVVAAIGYYGLTPANPDLDTDDATAYTADLTLRVLYDVNALTFGGFIGTGAHDDGGDSDESMTYRFIGAELSGDTSFGGYFAQIGYLDSADEYDEGTQDAPFIHVGGSYDFANGMTAYGTLGYATGKKYAEDDNTIIDLALGVERPFGDVTGYAEWRRTEISYDDSGTSYGDTFDTLSIGIVMEFGGDADHGSPLPPLGRWVAYNANEIE